MLRAWAPAQGGPVWESAEFTLLSAAPYCLPKNIFQNPRFHLSHWPYERQTVQWEGYHHSSGKVRGSPKPKQWYEREVDRLVDKEVIEEAISTLTNLEY